MDRRQLLDDLKAQELLGASSDAAVRQNLLENLRRMEHRTSGTGSRTPMIGPDTLAPGGLDDFGLRADIQFSGSTKAKIQKFQDAYPEGEMKLVKELTPGGAENLLVFRKTPGEPYRRLDALISEGWELGDIADLSGDIPAALGEMVATVGSRGINLIRLVLRAGAGAVGGDLARSGAERARGMDPGNVTSQALEQGLFGATGVTAGGIVEKGINAARGAGALNVPPKGVAVLRETERRGLPGLMPGQVSTNPVAQAFYRQARALSPTINELERTQEREALNLLKGFRDQGIAVDLPQNLLKSLEAKKTQINLRLSQLPKTSASRAGKEIIKAVRTWSRDMKGAVDAAYEFARNMSEPSFDLSEAQEVALNLKSGVRARLLAPQGDAETVNVREINQKLLDVIGVLEKIDPNVTPGEGAAAPFDVLKELRSQLFDLKTPEDGVFRNEHRLAAELYSALTKTMDSPIGGDEGFQNAWKAASRLAASRFDVLENEFIARALKAHDGVPSKQFFDTIWSVGDENQIKFLKDIIGPAQWDSFRGAAVTSLMRGETKLAGLDPNALKQVFSAKELEQLRAVEKAFERIELSGVPEAIRTQSKTAGIVRGLVQNRNSKGIDELYRLSQRDKATKDSLRAGIIDYIFDRAVEETSMDTRHVGPKVDGANLRRVMRELHELGITRMLDFRDLRVMERFLPDYLQYVRGISADTGESIRRASIVQNLTAAPTTGIIQLGEEMTFGYIMTRPAVRNFIHGLGKKKVDLNMLKRLSGMAAILAKDIEDEREQHEEGESP